VSAGRADAAPAPPPSALPAPLRADWTTPRIVLGEGTFADVGRLAAALGRRALVVVGSGARGEPLAGLRARLADAGVAVAAVRHVAGEPAAADAEEGARAAREGACDVVVACGGGSVLDAGKAVAALAANAGALRDYLEVVGRGRPLAERALPVVAVPTTAGTGSEVTRNAVLRVDPERVKVSLRSPLMLPAVALVDPELTYALPPDVTASTGLDALTQCLEPLVTPDANPLSDAAAREGLRHAAASLARAVADGGDRAARRGMAVAAVCGGLALAHARLGAVHGFAAPLGGMFPVPHGVACARLLAPVAAANVRALRARAPGSPALARYAEAARLLTGDPSARAEDGAAWLAALVAALGVPGLARYGVAAGDVPAVVAAARRASSMQGNPVALTDAELAGALEAALDG
jgi:alcohol dehydrogenase class IV